MKFGGGGALLREGQLGRQDPGDLTVLSFNLSLVDLGLSVLYYSQ